MDKLPVSQTVFHEDPLNYELSMDCDGVRKAVNSINTLIILPDGETKLFQRRAMKIGKNKGFDSALVGELDGVRVYIKGNEIVLTKQDLRL